jgi:hypothetical protein
MAETSLSASVREGLNLDRVTAGILEKEAIDGDIGHHGWGSEDLNGRFVLESIVPRVDILNHDGQ